MKKKLTYSIAAFLLLAGSGMVPAEAEAASLEEMEEQKQQLEMRSGEVENDIQDREQQMNQLQTERETLEQEVHTLQTNIDELIMKLHEQEEQLSEINQEIERLQSEIETLKTQIAQREDKLKHQARAVQTQGDPTTIINIIVSAENLSDLVGRVGVVNQLVDANKNIVTQQIADQEALAAAEEQVVAEREEIETIKAQMEVDRDSLVSQKAEMDNTIIQVAELYDMNAEEKAAFVEEQQVIAQQTSSLDAEMQAERERILEEERARIEAERKAEEERLRIEAEEKARAEAEAAARAEAEAQVEAEAAAAAETKSQRAKEEVAVASQSTETSSSSSSNTNTSSNNNARAEQEARQKAEAQKRAEEEASRKAAAERQARAERERKEQEERARKEQERKQAAKKNSSGFIRPSNGYVTSHYGYRIHPIYGYSKLHAGLDIAGGGPIVAAQSGRVVRAQYNSGWGYYVKIDHGNGLQTLYAHMQAGSTRVRVGQQVSQGQQIGTMGTTGASTGVHLHFEVYKNGRTVNPAPYLGL